jgi:hypothetical protein
MEPLQFIVKNFYTIIGSILAICFSAHLVYRNAAKARVADKKQEFGNAVLAILGDLCNESHYWSKNSFKILRGSADEIEASATKLSTNLGTLEKFRLNQAVNSYRKNSYQTWDEQASWTFYQKNKWFNKSPVSKIKKAINRLLKYAK